MDNDKLAKLAEKNGINLAAPTFEERMEAQVTYTAMMTDTLIEEDEQ